MTDIVGLNAEAVRASVDIVTGITDTDLARPTPCGDWTLAELLAHMTVQHHGFAAAAEGDGADLARWQPGPPAADAARAIDDYTAAADRVIAAFAADGVLDAPFSLPEITTKITFPGRQAIGFHFVDYVVHAWDVARSLGRDYEPASDLLEPALKIALVVPDDERRRRPGAAFAPRLDQAAQASTMEKILALLGRRPEWPDE